MALKELPSSALVEKVLSIASSKKLSIWMLDAAAIVPGAVKKLPVDGKWVKTRIKTGVDVDRQLLPNKPIKKSWGRPSNFRHTGFV